MTEKDFISPSLAQTIVDAAKNVIGKEINFIDLTCTIIASTDKSRIGNYHTAARLVIEKTDIVEINDTQAFPGTKTGINYPITVENVLVGVIGITGNPDECRSLGFLLMKICEVFIKEQLLLRKTTKRDELRSSFVRMMLFEEVDITETKRISSEQLAYPLEENVFVGILQRNSPDPQQIQNYIQSHNIALFTYMFPNQCAFIANQSAYKAIINKIRASQMDEDLYIAFGNITTIDSLAQSYQNAKTTLQYGISQQIRVAEYHSLQFEILLQTVDKRSKNDFINKALGNLNDGEKALLTSYFKQNLSLKDTANSLFIHKNTLQYRLDKIKEKTGLDPRHFSDSIQLYVALKLQSN